MNNNISKDLYKKYFREEENHSVTFLGEKLVILFPKEYVKKKIVEITNKTINILGIFEGYIFDDIRIGMEEHGIEIEKFIPEYED